MISKLANGFIESPNHYNGRTAKICKFTPHHMAGVMSAEQCANIFTSSSRNASANYCIGNDGKLICCVEEENGAWTSSSKWNDNQAITVEVSNCEYGGEWKVSDAAWNTLVELAVDVCRRYNFKLEYDGTCNGSLTEHRMFIPTACPGQYLHNRMKELADTVNARLESVAPSAEHSTESAEIAEPDYTGPITYQAFYGKWLEEVYKCDGTPEGYAGDGIHFISGVRAKPKFGEIIIEAHKLNGKWLGPVSSKNYKAYDITNGNSYAGLYGTKIDAFRIKSTRGYVDYRVLIKYNGKLQWLDWVRGFGNSPNEYAGIFGLPIYGIQMK